MRTRQFQRFAYQKMNQKFPENFLPVSGISLKKNQKFNRKSRSFSMEKKRNQLFSKLQQVYAPLIRQSALPTNLKTRLQPLFSLDQVNFEVKKGQTQKTSDFGYQLHERKKLRWFYGGLSTRTLRRLLIEAKKTKVCGTTALFQSLEKRLDVLLYRCGFFESIYAARQWILQKRVSVNQRVVERISYELQPGDVITIEKKWHAILMKKNFERFLLFFKNSGEKIDEKNYKNILFSVPSSQFNKKSIENIINASSSQFLENFFIQISKEKTVSQILKTKRNPYIYRPFYCMKPLHLETSYKTFTCIYLYPPQKISFPSLMDISAIQKSYSL